MRIYQHEKDDGLDCQMNTDESSTAFVTAQVRIGDLDKYFDGMSVADIAKAAETVQTVEELLGQPQPDLALVVAILASTGWNQNDDVFTPAELWKAKYSPVNKPINDNHDAKKILGHMVKSRVLYKDGSEIDVATTDTPPDEFDIEVAGVLYRAFPELRDRIDDIISKANNGEMFVSMECWFPDFGYGFIDPDTGETKLIERTEATAFLTKHLIIYGGCGEYQGYKIGRVLKDIVFGAQGFVDEPANPESVIKVAANRIAASRSFVTAELSALLEGGVEDVDAKTLKEQEFEAKLEEALASLEVKEKELVELRKVAKEFATKDYDGQIVSLNEKVDGLTASVTEASDKVDVVEVAKSEIQKQLDEVTERANKGEAELEGIRKNEIARDRLVKLSEVKLVENEEVTLAELREMTDETFEVVLKYAGGTKSKKVESDRSKDKTDASDKDDKDKIAKENEAEQAVAALDNVEEDDSADFNAGENVAESESAMWLSTARALCGNKVEKDEGGE